MLRNIFVFNFFLLPHIILKQRAFCQNFVVDFLGLHFNFPEPHEASNLKISFSTVKTLQNSEIYNEIDMATL